MMSSTKNGGESKLGSSSNVFNPKFDTEGVIGDLGDMMMEPSTTRTGGANGAAAGSGQSSALNQTAIAIVKYYAMYLISQMTLENAKASFSRVKAEVTSSGFLSVTAFSIPKQSEIVTRLQGNLKTFWAPYGIIYGIVAAYSVVTSPFLLLSLFFIFAMYMFLFKIHSGQTVSFGEHSCDGTQKTAFFGVTSVLIFIFSGFLSYLVSILMWGSVVVLAHAALHNPVAPVLPIDDPDAIPLTGPASIDGL